MRGIARDLAAAGLGTLNPQDESGVSGTFESPIGVKIEDTEGCPLFWGAISATSKTVRPPNGCKTACKPLPAPISALVDITNLLSHDQCRPLHVYDADKLSGAILKANKSGRGI